jgi:hypothetical protein
MAELTQIALAPSVMHGPMARGEIIDVPPTRVKPR